MFTVTQDVLDMLSPEEQAKLLKIMLASSTSDNGNGLGLDSLPNVPSTVIGNRFTVDTAKQDGVRLSKTKALRWLNTASNKMQYQMSRDYRSNTFNKILRINKFKYERANDYHLVWANALDDIVITTSIGEYDRENKKFDRSIATFYTSQQALPTKYREVAKKAKQRAAAS